MSNAKRPRRATLEVYAPILETDGDVDFLAYQALHAPGDCVLNVEASPLPGPRLRLQMSRARFEELVMCLLMMLDLPADQSCTREMARTAIGLKALMESISTGLPPAVALQIRELRTRLVVAETTRDQVNARLERFAQTTRDLEPMLRAIARKPIACSAEGHAAAVAAAARAWQRLVGIDRPDGEAPPDPDDDAQTTAVEVEVRR